MAAADTTEADSWYALLSEAQAEWYQTFAAMVPWVLISAPTTLTTADGGLTYTFPSGVTPIYVELYDTTTSGRPLRPGAYWDPSADYVWEGSKIRFPQSGSKTFTAGPIARYIAGPTAVSASLAPTLVPDHARMLLVYRAVATWALRGGFQDPGPFEQAETRYWLGHPITGRPGLLAALVKANPFAGASALTGYNELSGLSYLSTGSGYVPLS